MTDTTQATASLSESRKNPLIYESDGDFNPGWILFIVFSILGALISIGAVAVSFLIGSATPVIAALSFISFAMICTAAIVVPIARAKLLVRLRSSVGDIGNSMLQGNSYFGGSSYATPYNFRAVDDPTIPMGSAQVE